MRHIQQKTLFPNYVLIARQFFLTKKCVVVFNESENGNVNPTPVKQHSLPTELSFEVTNEAYTKGINVEQANISGKAFINYLKWCTN